MSDKSLYSIITPELHALIVTGNYELDYGTELYERLYEYYLPEMPYGVAKARTGDPIQWIFDRLCVEF